MPDEQSHLAQAARNETFFGTIDKGSHAEWAVTVLFYAALHYVDAFLAQKSEHPNNHEGRDRLIRSHPKTSAIRPFYLRLLDRSYDARYNCAAFTDATVQSLVANDFEPLKNALKS